MKIRQLGGDIAGWIIDVGKISDDTSFRYQDVFVAGHERAYQIWREQKLADWAQLSQKKIIVLDSISKLDRSETPQILEQCNAHNFAIYQLNDAISEKELRPSLIKFCKSMGLNRAEIHRSQASDGIVSIQVEKHAIGTGYIPYSNKSLSWHSDGYYNGASKRILGMILHCVRDASEGGVNELLDHEIAYIRLRDINPAYVTTLMHKETMTIPENTDERSAYRPPSIGPVFFFNEVSGRLQMRYSARGRNIIWRDDDETTKARALLSEIMADDPMIVRHKLQPGQGVISNNILHNRTKFSHRDDESSTSRLLYRIRYLDAVNATNSNSMEANQ
ncbi:MAG: TauD/TfdA family dioxygenase [Hyphomicrobiales bacterium]|nr:TauD/TfdA family dioxygenase [Hyphomicrobiales bacterium]